ncbi:MAG TPA: class I SAM-dependent methyltransferase [Beijerinckiaceae bacterium]|jgi:SAM-dependent methyltransferase
MAGHLTAGADYAERLTRVQEAGWKRLLDVQAPYRWHVRSLRLGRTLDVGCGIGRNLAHLRGEAVGVDHNPAMVAASRARGFRAWTTAEWASCPDAVPGAFDSLLVAHVVEHMTEEEALGVLSTYLPFLRPGGRVALVTPQERGYATDATHVRFVSFAELRTLCERLGLAVEMERSFPFPRAVGRIFPYNEFVTVARLP